MLTLTINGQTYKMFIGYEELDAFFEAIPAEGGELFTSYAMPDDKTHYHGGDVPMYLVNGYRPSLFEVNDWSSHDRSTTYLKANLTGEAVLYRNKTPWDENLYWSEDGKIALSNDVNDYLGGIFDWSC